MIKKIYLLAIFITVLSFLVFFGKQPPPATKPVLLDLTQITEKPPIQNEFLLLLNERNSKVKNIVYPDIRIAVEGFNLSSKLFYEKDRRFRMMNWSIFGKETDVGSNDEYF